MTSPIVCGVDGSKHSHVAAQLAATLADRLGLTLMLVHVAGAPSVSPQRRRTTLGLELATSEHRRHHERRLRELASQLNAAQADTRVEIGLPADWLVETADACSAALVVAGCRGAGVGYSILRGSVSAELTRRAPCPVMIVPPLAAHPRAAQLAGGRIVCGVKTSKDAPAARLAARLAASLGMGLTLAHVLPAGGPVDHAPIQRSPQHRRAASERSALDLLSGVLGSDDDAGTHLQRVHVLAEDAIEFRLRSGSDASEQLAALAATEQTALIVVGSRGRGVLRSELLGSVSRHLATSASCPVMICRDSARTRPAPAAIALGALARHAAASSAA